MNNLKVTEGMAEAADVGHIEDGIAAALAHPDFRKQVAELMRGMVPDADDPKEHPGVMSNDYRAAAQAEVDFRNETLAHIAEWESAK